MKAMQEDIAKLLLRLFFGLSMLFAHGMPKLLSFSEKKDVFPDPLGLGSSLSLGLAIFAEVLCAGLITLGVFTRFTVIPLVITMLVAAFIVKAGAPFAKKELALAFLFGYAAIGLLGPGAFSIDKFLKRT
jgi:putative oxidoreductase